MKNEFADFIDDLKNTHGNNLVSVILYGSAAVNATSSAPEDFNLLIALRQIRPKDLRAAHASTRTHTASAGMPRPPTATLGLKKPN